MLTNSPLTPRARSQLFPVSRRKPLARSRISSFALNRFGSKAQEDEVSQLSQLGPQTQTMYSARFAGNLTQQRCDVDAHRPHMLVLREFVSRVRGSEFGETRKRCIIQRTESRNFNKRKIRPGDAQLGYSAVARKEIFAENFTLLIRLPWRRCVCSCFMYL